MTLSLTLRDDLSKAQGHLCIPTSLAFPSHSSGDSLVLVQPRVDEGGRNPSLTQPKMKEGKQVGRQSENKVMGNTLVRASKRPPWQALGSMDCLGSLASLHLFLYS